MSSAALRGAQSPGVLCRLLAVPLLGLGACRPVTARVTTPAAAPAADAPTAAVIEGDIVQRSVTLHLERPDGPPIGTVHRGAKVHVERRDGAWVEVVVPGVDRPIRTERGMTSGPLTAWIEGDALGRGPTPPAMPTVRGWSVRDHYRQLKLVPGGTAFAYTACGALEVIEATEAASRVSQTREGFELVGWTDTPIDTPRGEYRCEPRVFASPGGAAPGSPAPAIPSGFVAVGDVDAGLRTLARPRTIYWSVDGERCDRWQLGRTTLRRQQTIEGARMRVEYAVEREADAITLYGPSVVPVGSTTGAPSWAGGGGDRFTVVGHADDRVVLLPGARHQPVLAYHPDDADAWYTTAAACEAGLRRSTPGPVRIAANALAGLSRRDALGDDVFDPVGSALHSGCTEGEPAPCGDRRRAREAASNGRAREQLRREVLAVLTDPDDGVRACVPTGAMRQVEASAYFAALAQAGDPHDPDTAFARDYFRTVTVELAVALDCGGKVRALVVRRREIDGVQSHRVIGVTDWAGVESAGLPPSAVPATTRRE